MGAPKVISLFTGAGGLDLGLEAAGFDCAVAVELDSEAVSTVRANRDWNILERDIHDVSSEELLTEAGLKVGEADLLVGGPPCQPFSKSGYWRTGDSKRLEDPRARTLDAYLRVLRDTKPKAFMLENVPGMAFSEKAEGLDFLRSSLEQINKESGTFYSLQDACLNATEYGVPQARERVFVIGQREGAEFVFPEPTHNLPVRISMGTGVPAKHQPCIEEALLPPTTAWDAIGRLELDTNSDLRVQGKWADLLPSIPEGHNYLFHTSEGNGRPVFGYRCRYHSMLLKLAKNRPSWTLTAQPGPAIGPFHWKNRRLSADELCALQTFPSDYRIVGNIRAAYRQLGNAVPSALAELLGQQIRVQLLGSVVDNLGKLSLLPKRRPSVPAPERVLPVDKQYWHLIGEHASHPGTGLGPGAQARVSS